MPRPTLRRATCLATTLQRCQRAWEARRSPERAASINSVESGGLACSPSRACRCVTYIQNTQNYRKSNGCIEGRLRAVCGSGKRPASGHRAPCGLVTECVGRFFWQIRTRTHKSPCGVMRVSEESTGRALRSFRRLRSDERKDFGARAPSGNGNGNYWRRPRPGITRSAIPSARPSLS